MEPTTFRCRLSTARPAIELTDELLDVSRWSDFTGYGPLPGIDKAQYEVRTAEIVGSRIRVSNSDGSCHVEEIIEWESGRYAKLRLRDFDPPVSCIASHFDETWSFEENADTTLVRRCFEMYPTSRLTRPLLWFIGFFMKKAVQRHLRRLTQTG